MSDFSKNQPDKIQIKRPDGEVEEYKLLLNYHDEVRNADFVMVYDEDDTENIILFQYFSDGTLDVVYDEKILAEAQEILTRFEDEVDI